MQIITFPTSVPNIVTACIDETECFDASGHLYNRYSEEAIPFDSIMQMIETMECFYNQINFPQASTQHRSFRKTKEARCNQEMEKIKMTNKEVIEQRGEKGTFIINVQYRQNSSWQGQVIWAEKDKTMSFRSALELIKLIDSALDSSSHEDQSEDKTTA